METAKEIMIHINLSKESDFDSRNYILMIGRRVSYEECVYMYFFHFDILFFFKMRN